MNEPQGYDAWHSTSHKNKKKKKRLIGKGEADNLFPKSFMTC